MKRVKFKLTVLFVVFCVFFCGACGKNANGNSASDEKDPYENGLEMKVVYIGEKNGVTDVRCMLTNVSYTDSDYYAVVYRNLNIKAIFIGNNGFVIDEQVTQAVGEQWLQPGDIKTFSYSVRTSQSIEHVYLSAIF